MRTRREFLIDSMKGACASCIASGLFLAGSCSVLMAREKDEKKYTKEAMYYEKKEEMKILCKLCPRECSVADLERGYCGVRENRGGIYYTLVHSRPCTYHVDPIEKKPFFHFLPGSTAFSIATAGCNVECRFCQNWDISQFRPEQLESIYMPPETVHAMAKKSGARSIAYTYSEPVVFYEYVLDTARLGPETGIRSVVVSNGYIQEKAIIELCQHLGAIKIDLKAFTEKFYREVCNGKLEPVLKTLLAIKKTGIWFEIVVLIIPTLNDSEIELRKMSRWIRENLGPDVPVHFTRFHPTYKIKNLPRTPLPVLERARDTARSEGLNFVYMGNVPGHESENTICPSCKNTIIKRYGYLIMNMDIANGKCGKCARTIPGVWS
ncbi:MAG: AmmeMemoRadiSam system radical SAM enzyme [Acidobacteriota bacterium]